MVYSAFDPDLGRRLAIKRIAPTGDADLARMLREAQALARLSHPHVIQIYDVGTHLDRVYVAMELVEGGTLRGWMKPEQARRDMQALGEALASDRPPDMRPDLPSMVQAWLESEASSATAASAVPR